MNNQDSIKTYIHNTRVLNFYIWEEKNGMIIEDTKMKYKFTSEMKQSVSNSQNSRVK